MNQSGSVRAISAVALSEGSHCYCIVHLHHQCPAHEISPNHAQCHQWAKALSDRQFTAEEHTI